MPEQRPDDLLADAHDGVAAAGGMAAAVARDAADASLFGKVSVPAIQNLVREHATTRIREEKLVLGSQHEFPQIIGIDVVSDIAAVVFGRWR